MIKPEQMIASFYQVITQQPELFQGEAFQDLSDLEIALDKVEYQPNPEKLEFIADAITDFCDYNPDINQAVRSQLEQHPDQIATEEIIPALTEIVNSLLEKEEQTIVTYEGTLQPEQS
ncbi:MAG: hypothetical protein WBA13_11745 [Microcoleaceae cyanobacterium]